ncbi:MAG: hypothetical protein ABWY52_04350 [Candidatus Limnocylindrales bacterium]
MRIVWVIVRAVVWLLAAALIAIGAAGLAGAANPVPDEASRPEVFARADAAMAPGLAAIDAQLRDAQELVAALASLSRSAIVNLNAGDQEALVKDLDDGDLLVVEIGSIATAVAADLRSLPFDADAYQISGSVAGRVEAAREAVETVRPLADLWSRVARGALPASEIAKHLADHDLATFAATQDGTAGHYADALRGLGTARAELTAALEIRDQLLESVDTTTLDLWVDRNRKYDDALARLYQALQLSRGRVNDVAREAFADVQRAQKLLPPDTRAIVVIMSDLAQGGLNQAAIRIDEARGALIAAVAAVD